MQTLPDQKAIGLLIRKARIAKQYTQQRLAICAGYRIGKIIHQQTIALVEQGKRELSLSEAIAISAVLGGIPELSELLSPPQPQYTVKGEAGVPIALLKEYSDAGYSVGRIAAIAGIPPYRVEALLNFFESKQGQQRG